MASDTDYVEPLSGEEIVIDLCDQIAAKLRADCNLRPSDAYSGGYSAKIEIHLEAYGMDTAVVDAVVVTGEQKEETPDEILVTTLDIPVEPGLNMVRERSSQPVPTLTNEGGTPEIRPRRYVRSAVKTLGGATGEALGE
jgi:hypothetical protein